MKQVDVHQVRIHLSELLAQVAAGEEVIIASAGKPVARLVRWAEPKQRRRLGRDVGAAVNHPNFEHPTLNFQRLERIL